MVCGCQFDTYQFRDNDGGGGVQEDDGGPGEANRSDRCVITHENYHSKHSAS